ncbi:MAG TPA: ribonuclease H-like YkuK family protein [Patescibacteria group bacterium]|nr:ribonuclease H-like YkuK family protein [Patescibacteria group bacterium]
MTSDLDKNGFYSPTNGSVTFRKIVEQIAEFVDSDSKSLYSVIIGSDSQIKHSKTGAECDFVTAIVVHRHGYGARYFWKRETIKKAPVLRDRIYEETARSLSAAAIIVPVIRERIEKDKYNFEIHVDVGPNGKTREMIKELVGMVNGMGYNAKTKPYSWGASSVADKHT